MGIGGGTRDSETTSKRCIDWKEYLAMVTEAQRTSLLQLSGINVTSAAARAAFNEVRAAEELAAKKRERDSSRKEGGGSRRARGASNDKKKKRVGRRVRGSNGRGGGYGGGVGGSETEQQVAERNLRAFDQMNFVRG